MLYKRIKGAMLALLLAMPSAAWAIPSGFNSRFGKLEDQLSNAQRDFAQRSLAQQNQTADSRLSEGIVLQSAGDHQRASYIFMDIVSHDEWRGKPAYQTAQLQLARSLYESGYYRLSQKHLIDLLKNGSGTERTDSVMLLLQVAQKTGDWPEVNAALADSGEFSRSPAYLYIMGRAMFLQDELETARMSLKALNGDDEWSVKAAYLIGVIEVKEKNLEAAVVQFKKVTSSKSTFKNSDMVRELAELALARIYFEQEKWSDALDQYQKIPETSVNFPAVLYEIGWTRIRQEDYIAAQQSFELLLLSYPKDRHALETRRLLADIMREIGKYDEATASYQTIVNEFEPIMQKMEDDAANVEARKQQMKRQIEEENYREAHIVPERAKGVIDVGSDVNRIENMIDGLTVSDENTVESDRIVAEINAILADETNIQNMPEFSTYTQLSREIRINALLLGYEFTGNYQNMPDNISFLLEDVAGLPRSKQERDVMISILQTAQEERVARLHRLKLQTENLSQKSRILSSWLNGPQTASLTPEERQQYSAQLEDLEMQLNRLRDSQRRIESKLAEIRLNGGENSQKFKHALQSLDELQRALESQWAAALQSGNIDGDYREMINRERALLGRLDGLNDEINKSMQLRANDFRRRLNNEIELLNAEKTRYAAAKSSVGDTAGEVSARYWQSVYDQIKEMVLYADLGIVDIAWLQKDARSKELSAAMEERKKEREVLEQDFRQFLKESGQSE